MHYCTCRGGDSAICPNCRAEELKEFDPLTGNAAEYERSLDALARELRA